VQVCLPQGESQESDVRQVRPGDLPPPGMETGLVARPGSRRRGAGLLRNRSIIGVEWATWITANPHHLTGRTLEVVLNRLARGVLHMPQPHLVTLEELPWL
jgi:hypothetical protein